MFTNLGIIWGSHFVGGTTFSTATDQITLTEPPDPIRRTRLSQKLRNLWRFWVRGEREVGDFVKKYNVGPQNDS